MCVLCSLHANMLCYISKTVFKMLIRHSVKSNKVVSGILETMYIIWRGRPFLCVYKLDAFLSILKSELCKCKKAKFRQAHFLELNLVRCLMGVLSFHNYFTDMKWSPFIKHNVDYVNWFVYVLMYVLLLFVILCRWTIEDAAFILYLLIVSHSACIVVMYLYTTYTNLYICSLIERFFSSLYCYLSILCLCVLSRFRHQFKYMYSWFLWHFLLYAFLCHLNRISFTFSISFSHGYNRLLLMHYTFVLFFSSLAFWLRLAICVLVVLIVCWHSLKKKQINLSLYLQVTSIHIGPY